jgi:hypothetical protein
MGSTISVKQAAEAAVQTTSHPMAEPRTTAPVHRPLLCEFLKEQKSEILEIAQIIHDNIDQQRADLLVCIPELRKAMCDLMEASTNPQASYVVVTHTAAVQAQADRDHHDETGPTAKQEAQKEVATITHTHGHWPY